MNKKSSIQKAVLPALLTSTILITAGIMAKKSVPFIIFLGFLGLPIGYVGGNFGKWKSI